MSMPAFPNIARVEASDKVRGTAIYAADNVRPGMVHAALTVATIGRGRITGLDTAAARSLPGVLLVLTHEDLGELVSPGFLLAGGYAFQSLQVMTSPAIAYRGQPIALVAAETLEIATEAAALVRATYEAEPVQVILGGPSMDAVAQADSPLPKPMFADRRAGDADGAYADAEVRVEATYSSPPQHQNPMELLSTVAEWHGDRLIVHEGSQNVGAARAGLARCLKVDPTQVDVISPHLGGGFGQKNSLQMQTTLAAVAARRLGRPVKLVVPRSQGFHDSSFRPASRHHVRLGATREGLFTAAIYETESQTSRHDLYGTQYAEVAANLHGFANFRSREVLVRMDAQTPGYMRGPYEHAACFALECAVDELAVALGHDPVALRLANDTQLDTITKKPLSSRHVAACLRRGADLFGWARRQPAPGSMRAADGAAIGWGVAIGAYKASTAPAIARLEVRSDGRVSINVPGHDMGQGLRTAIAATVAVKLGVPADAVSVLIGDTRGVPQHLTAGSWGTATAIPAAAEAADAMLGELRQMAPSATDSSPFAMLTAAGRTSHAVEVQRRAPGQPDAIFQRLSAGLPAAAGPVYPDFTSFSYAAHFVEVRVDQATRRVRVPRAVSVVDCGRVVSPRTARSQVQGGVVWGIGAALREASEPDARYGGFINADFAEYVVPVNADIGAINVEFIDKPDPLLNAVGVKGLGEIAMVGVAPAIANAVFHATGRRIRDLPIRIEHLL